MQNKVPMEEEVINCLRTVVDPEFPLVDIYTMGLIYAIKIVEKGGGKWRKVEENGENDLEGINSGERDDEGFVSYGDMGQIIIDMTLTTPACPAADYLPEQAKNSVQIMYPEFEVILNLVWDPTWTIAMIKDEDLKRMFE